MKSVKTITYMCALLGVLAVTASAVAVDDPIIMESGYVRTAVSTYGAGVYSREFPSSDNWVAVSTPAALGDPDAVLCLCSYNDGIGNSIYVGTKNLTTEGNVYKYTGGTSWVDITPWSTINGGPYDVTSVYSLAEYDDKLYAGTDVPNILFEYYQGTWKAIPVGTGHPAGIRSLYVWGGRLYLDANSTDVIDCYDADRYHSLSPIPAP